MSRDSAFAPPDPVGSGSLAEAPADELRMRDQALREAKRVRLGMRRPHNWFQLVRFSLVGGSGYVVNLAVYSTLVVLVDVQYVLAAMIAFCVAVTNNFLLNRWWTFRATDGSVTFQAPRFLIVSLCALVLNLIVLEILVGVLDVHKVVAQAAAILTATPVNFVGNKLWSFRLGHARGEAPAEE